uniref:Uncharacterized protein n=1 Tax=Physcomitrium patens TaxID=3218 RepID=A0A2K1L4P5_PHYPA|nr:hypothetical protein PHYPA_003780 [Physcomitrium patens]
MLSNLFSIDFQYKVIQYNLFLVLFASILFYKFLFLFGHTSYNNKMFSNLFRFSSIQNTP